ncbi:hypothetical protein ACIQYL_25420 [Lysinibacillus xylanilyticus]
MKQTLNISLYISSLPLPIHKIKAELIEVGIVGEDLERALSSRLSDLE